MSDSSEPDFNVASGELAQMAPDELGRVVEDVSAKMVRAGMLVKRDGGVALDSAFASSCSGLSRAVCVQRCLAKYLEEAKRATPVDLLIVVRVLDACGFDLPAAEPAS